MAGITIKGVDKLSAKLTKAQRNDVLVPPTRRAVQVLEGAMKVYPAQHAGSSYIRTGTLGRRWTTNVRPRRDGVEGRVGNNTQYAPFVQADRFQARVHQGRWQTDVDVVRQHERAIVADFERAIAKALR